MTGKPWARVLLAVLLLAGAALIALHWRDGDSASYTHDSVKPAASAEPYEWPRGDVNVNTADRDELLTLSGINGAQIDALLSDRETNGAFDFPEDLVYIKGIGEKTLAKIYDQLDYSWRVNGN